MTCAAVTPLETTLTAGSFLTLPTAEPATPQFSYTLGSTDMPTFNVASFKVIPVLAYAGFWTSGTGNSVSYRYERVRGGTTTSLATGANFGGGPNNYHTAQVGGSTTIDSVVGDTVQMKLWVPAGNVVDVRWYSLAVIPTRTVMHTAGAKTYSDVAVTFQNLSYVGGVSPSVNNIGSWAYYAFNLSSSTGTSTAFNVPIWQIGEALNYGTGRFGVDLVTTSTSNTTTVKYPWFNRHLYLSQITYRRTAF